MTDIAILCPLALEYEAVHKFLKNPLDRKNNEYKLHFEQGQVEVEEGEWNVALFETGKGIDTLRDITTRIIHALRPKYLFLVGIAGGIKDVVIGDIVVATRAYNYESGRETMEGFLARPEMEKYSESLIRLAKLLYRQSKKDGNERKPDYNVVFGPIASGNKLIASRDSETFRIIEKHFNDSIAVEMEAFGFAAAAGNHQDVQAVNIRGISDVIEEKSKSDVDGSRELAAGRAAYFMSRLIRKLPYQEEIWDEGVKIFYCTSPFNFFDWRTPLKADLLFKKGGIEIRGEETYRIREIKRLDRVSMSGDIAKNWIRMTFRSTDGITTLYLSERKVLHGWKNLVGGSKTLFERLTEFKNNFYR